MREKWLVFRWNASLTSPPLQHWLMDEKQDQTMPACMISEVAPLISPILKVQVKSTNGDTHLGGDDIDQRVQDWLSAEFKKEADRFNQG